jgi:hypothetical protein
VAVAVLEGMVDSLVVDHLGVACMDRVLLVVGRLGMVVMVDTVVSMALQCVVVEVVGRSMDTRVVVASMNPFYDSEILQSCAIR